MKAKILLIACGICVSTMSSRAALIAHYKFDETSGASAADELGGTSGAIGSSVVIGVAGVNSANNAADRAIQLPDLATQAGIVDMGNATFYGSISTQVTYSLWMNSTDSDTNRNTILYSGSDTVANTYQDIGMSGETNPTINTVDGAASARNRPVGATIPQQTGIFSSPTVIHDGNWHHLALTVDTVTATMILYVDGVASATQNFSAATVLFPSFNNFEIGRLGRQGSPTDAYGGLVDDVQVYNHALSLGEIQYLFQNPGTAVPEPGSLALGGLGLLLLTFRRRA